ncbi:MAG: TetR family transcriptional regulator [Acidimicrobiales bacterium]|nr:TetR family transcriptional regulator [Acidimicrobiales bacterium]
MSALTSAVPGGDEDLLGARLLAAATEVFAERGYAGARVADIARRAGVTTGAIYSRYRGKAELLAEAIDAATGHEFDVLFSDHRFEGRMEDILRIAGSHLVERRHVGARSHAPGMLLESFAAARHEPDVVALLRDRMQVRHDRLAEIVEAAKESGGIDHEVDTEALVTFCHAVGLGFLLLEVLDRPLPDAVAWELLIIRLLAATGDPSTFAATAAPPAADAAEAEA